MSPVRLPRTGERISIPVGDQWLPAVVSSETEFGPAGHCPGYFCFNLLGTKSTIGGCGTVGTEETYDGHPSTHGEGRGWRFDDAPRVACVDCDLTMAEPDAFGEPTAPLCSRCADIRDEANR
jgi:hypothetical protein